MGDLVKSEKDSWCCSWSRTFCKSNLDTFVTALSFVYAWAVFDSATDIVAAVYGCDGKAGACKSWRFQFFFAFGFSCVVVFVSTSTSDDGHTNATLRHAVILGYSPNDAHVFAKERVLLWTTAAGLSVGWAWTNFSDAFLDVLAGDWMECVKGKEGLGEVSWLMGICVGIVLMAVLVPLYGNLYHAFLERHRSPDALLATAVQDRRAVAPLGLFTVIGKERCDRE